MPDKSKLFAKFVDMNFVRIKGILHEKVKVLDLININIVKEDGTWVPLGDEYKEEFLHGRSPYMKFLNNNSSLQSYL